MPPPDKDALRRLFQYRCGYCGIRESDAGSELTIDHFQPRSRGGTDEPTNLVYSCHACNEFKGDYWEPDSPRRILHPLRDDPTVHLAVEPEGTLRPLTETGGFHIDRLRLNRPPLVEYRREHRLREAARRAERELLDRLRELDDRLGRLISDVERLRSGDGAA